jgi:hypothetical protein
MTPQLLRGIINFAAIRPAGWINTLLAKNGNLFRIAVSPYAGGMKVKAYP